MRDRSKTRRPARGPVEDELVMDILKTAPEKPGATIAAPRRRALSPEGAERSSPAVRLRRGRDLRLPGRQLVRAVLDFDDGLVPGGHALRPGWVGVEQR